MIKKELFLFLVFLLILTSACAPSTEVKEETSSGSQVTSKPTVIEFYADWWSACREVAPTVSRVKERYKDQVDFQLLNVDLNETRGKADKYGVRAIPTFVFIDKSGKVTETFVGVIEESSLVKKIEELL